MKVPFLKHERIQFGYRQISIGVGITIVISSAFGLIISNLWIVDIINWIKSKDISSLKKYIEILLKSQMCIGLILIIIGVIFSILKGRKEKWGADSKGE